MAIHVDVRQIILKKIEKNNKMPCDSVSALLIVVYGLMCTKVVMLFCGVLKKNIYFIAGIKKSCVINHVTNVNM